jgi:hypothetical protein
VRRNSTVPSSIPLDKQGIPAFLTTRPTLSSVEHLFFAFHRDSTISGRVLSGSRNWIGICLQIENLNVHRSQIEGIVYYLRAEIELFNAHLYQHGSVSSTTFRFINIPPFSSLFCTFTTTFRKYRDFYEKARR